MAHPHTIHSQPICPTCQSDLSDREELAYFVGDAHKPPKNDDLSSLYEETSRLARFLGALAQAGPLAVAFHFNGIRDAQNDYMPEWVTDFSWLAEQLTKETERRLWLLKDAGRIWEKRATRLTAGKEA